MNVSRTPRKERLTKGESGSVLVEFALISLILYMILAATVDFGRMFLVSNVAASAARTAAVWLSTSAAAKTAPTFADLLNDPTVRCQIYDPGLLVIDPKNPIDPDPACAFNGNQLPVVNQTLFQTAMISDFIGGVNVYHYPGAMFTDPTAISGYKILIPVVASRSGTGVETLTWVDVLEESKPGSLASGVIAVRVNYPYQAAMLSGFRPSPDGPYEPNIVDKAHGGWGVNDADDAAVSAPSTPDVASDIPYGAYSGPYGLGVQLAFAGKTVRPYRRLLAGEATEKVGP
jgi:TadE-like protein